MEIMMEAVQETNNATATVPRARRTRSDKGTTKPPKVAQAAPGAITKEQASTLLDWTITIRNKFEAMLSAKSEYQAAIEGHRAFVDSITKPQA
jgi:hypothetical protein